ncbi:MAG: DUF3822 family protein [Schleiferiaceae bacterium]|nr:DUF3822 family protein [Schleiferiaceae bacterium]
METGNKVQVIFEAADALLDQTDISNSRLSILHSGDGLSFSLLNKERNKFVLLGAYKTDREEDHRKLFEFVERFTDLPGDVSYASTDNTFSLVPKVLFDESNAQKYLSLISTETPKTVGVKELDEWVLVYEDSSELTDWVKTHLPNVKVLNGAEVVISYYQQKFKNTSESLVMCHVMGNRVELTCIENGVLTLHNVFSFNSVQDFTYYILSVFEQLKFNPEEIPVYLSGWLTKLSPEVDELRKYIRNIEWEARPKEFEYSYTFNDSAEHSFNRLFQQSLCVL